MAAKSKNTKRSKTISRPAAKAPVKNLAKPTSKALTKTLAKLKARSAAKPVAKTVIRDLPRPKALKTKIKARQPVRTLSRRIDTHKVSPSMRNMRMPQFNYMKAPGMEQAFDVGDTVEVFCDHERNNERVRGWIKGIVVQVDNKMAAVQFRSNVFLTDGWMVPDRILWYSLTSDQIRSTGVGQKSSHRPIPDY